MGVSYPVYLLNFDQLVEIQHWDTGLPAVKIVLKSRTSLQNRVT